MVHNSYQPWCTWCGGSRLSPCRGTLDEQRRTRLQQLLALRARYLAELDFSYSFVTTAFAQLEHELAFLAQEGA